ncbi:hypothetical protein SAMN05216389_12266 [Oceanobacillus limi]|uniref:ABC-2 type transport system permease protein n=1 Tax=Oceanobacillus limi TaxID=930131 RepID=A0A1I0GL92_9BACI|nr:hypothetical protein [Oceanobacillus limi]SET71795.1 hypothetical protein SAMN05216389_12266 [Oceanobacillus limi]
MGRQIRGLLYFYMTDIRYSLMIFWSILFGILVVSLSFSYFLLGVDDGMMAFGFPFATYFYCIFLGFITVKEGIPFSLKMGATRKNIFISIGVFFFLIALVKALVSNTLHLVTYLFKETAGIHTFHLLHPAQFMEDTWLNRVVIDTSVMFFLLVFTFVLGLLFYKFGMVGAGSVTALLVVALLLGIAQGWAVEFIVNLFADVDILFFLQVLAVGILGYLLTFVLVRRITIVKVK